MKSHEDTSLPHSNKSEVDQNTTYFFVSDKGLQYPFVFRNSSNGYYSGSFDAKWKTKPLELILPDHLRYSRGSATLSFIVGLPEYPLDLHIRHKRQMAD